MQLHWLVYHRCALPHCFQRSRFLSAPPSAARIRERNKNKTPFRGHQAVPPPVSHSTAARRRRAQPAAVRLAGGRADPPHAGRPRGGGRPGPHTPAAVPPIHFRWQRFGHWSACFGHFAFFNHFCLLLPAFDFASLLVHVWGLVAHCWTPSPRRPRYIDRFPCGHSSPVAWPRAPLSCPRPPPLAACPPKAPPTVPSGSLPSAPDPPPPTQAYRKGSPILLPRPVNKSCHLWSSPIWEVPCPVTFQGGQSACLREILQPGSTGCKFTGKRPDQPCVPRFHRPIFSIFSNLHSFRCGDPFTPKVSFFFRKDGPPCLQYLVLYATSPLSHFVSESHVHVAKQVCPPIMPLSPHLDFLFNNIFPSLVW